MVYLHIPKCDGGPGKCKICGLRQKASKITHFDNGRSGCTLQSHAVSNFF